MGLDIDECISSFNYILLNASKCMLKNIYPNNHQNMKFKNDWFDQDCMVARKQVKHDLRMFRKLRSCDSKHVYIQSRKVYKALLKQKKYNYSENKITSIIITIHDQIKFWKAIKSIIGGGNPNQINCIEIKEFFKHFSKMFNFVKPKSSICNELLYMYSDDFLCVDFNMQITLEEIRDRLLVKN